MSTAPAALPTTSRLIPARTEWELIELTGAAGLRVQLHHNGVPLAFRLGSLLLNGYLPDAGEQALSRLVLREAGTVTPLCGSAPGLAFARSGAAVAWSGTQDGLTHRAELVLAEGVAGWAWRVTVTNRSDRTRRFDLLHGQELALCEERNARHQEGYISHYIDQRPVADPQLGWVLLCRQGQPQTPPSGGAAALPGCDGHGGGRRFPWLALACAEGATAYATDGWQFFGPSHRLLQQPAAWTATRLPSTVLQYEFSFPALQTGEIELASGASRIVTFAVAVREDHPAASADADVAAVRAVLAALPRSSDATAGAVSTAGLFTTAPIRAGDEPSGADWAAWFPGDRRHDERDPDGQPLSFFTGDWHAVSRRKEARVARPHGWVLRSGRGAWVDPDAVGATVYAGGIFASQLYTGNPSFARLLSPVRDHLGVARTSGQRVFVQLDGRWQQLGVPSAFAMQAHGARWLYRLGDRVVEVTTQGVADRPALRLDLRVLAGGPLAFLITHQVAAGNGEHDEPVRLEAHPEGGWIAVAPGAGTALARRRPGTAMAIVACAPQTVAALGGDELLWADGRPRGTPYAVLRTHAVEAVTIALTITHTGLAELPQLVAAERAAEAPAPERCSGTASLTLSHPRDAGAARLSEIVPWFAHHAWIHFTIPHGLEQCDGGAWGTRDVSQGDIEWLTAIGSFAAARQALRVLFAHQYHVTGDFPQYFLVPPYESEQYRHAHGDVPVWPIKALADWIEATGDLSILDEPVAYTDEDTLLPLPGTEPIHRHVDRLLEHLRTRQVPGTALLNYGDGDWDDTMQPAHPALRATMISAWTVELAFQAVSQYAEVCRRSNRAAQAAELTAWTARMRADAQRLLMPDGVVAGFAIVGADGACTPVVHPRDRRTNIRYRLLPMTRGIISGLFTAEEAQRHRAIIQEHLLFPDGARLTSDTATYRGGEMHLFQRAESCANFGREIGLLYVHAHIRYAEAMAVLGDADALWRALQVVNPIGLKALVPHSDERQANTYFTSSDGDFPDRYQAGARYHDLRGGTIAVKAGWRFHSSGPGLFLNKLITRLLGVRGNYDELIIDPVLPTALDGLRATLDVLGRPCALTYAVTGGPVRAVTLNGTPLTPLGREANPYRPGGLRFARSAVEALLKPDRNRLDIVL